MRYHQEKDNIPTIALYGVKTKLNHEYIKEATLYSQHGLGFYVVQKKFDPKTKSVYFGAIEDPDIQNKIYLSENFEAYFFAKAYPNPAMHIVELRKLMWALRMKPLKKEPWENAFNRNIF